MPGSLRQAQGRRTDSGSGFLLRQGYGGRARARILPRVYPRGVGIRFSHFWFQKNPVNPVNPV